tara:strand:+ start:337 stop:528 length:192 start_codon:yes stop_codon:yes gene_type:complete
MIINKEEYIKYDVSLECNKKFTDFLRQCYQPLKRKNGEWFVPIFLVNKFKDLKSEISNENIPF